MALAQANEEVVEAGNISIIAGTGGIIGMDIWATIDERMHENSPILGEGLQMFVRDLTPIRTGALLMDISYEAYLDPGNEDLVWVYAEDIAQEAFWNRVYVAYQEGGPLGLETYTNDPHQMFFDTATGYGLDLTEFWAAAVMQEAIDLCIAGAGVPV